MSKELSGFKYVMNNSMAINEQNRQTASANLLQLREQPFVLNRTNSITSTNISNQRNDGIDYTNRTILAGSNTIYENYIVWFSNKMTDLQGKTLNLSKGEEVKVVLPVEKTLDPEWDNSELVKIFYDNSLGWYCDQDLKKDSCYADVTKLEIYKHPSRWSDEAIGSFKYNEKVTFPIGVNLIKEDGAYWIKVYFNGLSGELSEGWVRRSLLKEGSGNEGNGDDFFIPEEVIKTINGVQTTLYPRKNWGAPGQGTYPTGTQKDASGRYKIAVGPKIINSLYPDNGKIWDGYDGLSKGIKVDVHVKDVNGNLKVIECVVVDFKAHTYNEYPDGHPSHNLTGDSASFNVESGLLQTGIAYPNSYNADKGLSFSKKDATANVIEFAGHTLDFNPTDYELVDIKVVP